MSLRPVLRLLPAVIFLIVPFLSEGFAQVQPTVLVEVFRNMDCATCAAPNSTLESYVTAHPGVILINYNTSTPNANDALYIASLPGSQAREQFYGGTSGLTGPTAYVNGIFAGTGAQMEPQWEAYINAGITKPVNPQFPTVQHGPNGIDTISFVLNPRKIVHARVALIESNVYYVNSSGGYGRPTGDLWNHVFRAMLPSPSGSDPFSGMKFFNVVYDPSQFTFSGNKENMTAVMFTQEEAATGTDNSHQVPAMGFVSLATPSAVTEIASRNDGLILSSGPLAPKSNFRFSLAKAADVQIVLYDLLGREIRTLVSGQMPSGETTVELNGTAIPAGVYIARMTASGRTVDQKKFVTE